LAFKLGFRGKKVGNVESFKHHDEELAVSFHVKASKF